MCMYMCVFLYVRDIAVCAARRAEGEVLQMDSRDGRCTGVCEGVCDEVWVGTDVGHFYYSTIALFVATLNICVSVCVCLSAYQCVCMEQSKDTVAAGLEVMHLFKTSKA